MFARMLLLGSCLFLALGERASVHSAATERLYAPPAADEVRTRALEWVAAQKVRDPAVQEAVGRFWTDLPEHPDARELLDRLIETFALVDPQTREFVETCRFVDAPLLPPEAEVLQRPNADSFHAANVGLFYARYLADRALYDEALQVLRGIDPASVVDPATYFFYKAVCEHELLLKTEALQSLKTLLSRTEDVPVSYAQVARLMQYKLQRLQEKSLDTVARMMKDVRRRLGLGRGGQTVQKKEEEVVALLDELIEKMEQQSGSSASQAGGSGQGRGGRQSGSPARESRILGGTGPGEVDPEEFKMEGQWGGLPPKEEARAKNLINRNFPGHYRQAIEQYFKKLAKRRAER